MVIPLLETEDEGPGTGGSGVGPGNVVTGVGLVFEWMKLTNQFFNNSP
jgi:hypothetical protein